MKIEPVITVTMNPAIDRLIEVERFQIGGHQLGHERGRLAAGKGVNVSKALARLGVSTVATGFLGRENSQFFEQLLLSQPERPYGRHINLQFFDVAGRTRENITVLDSSNQAETHIRDIGAEIPERDLLRLKRKLDLMSRPGALVIFGGGLPPGVSPEQFAQVVHICHAGGARIAVDTSGAALTAVRDEPLFLVKPNRQELADLVGRELCDDREAIIAAGRQLAERCEYVLLSLGADGGLAFHGQTVLAGRVDVDPTRVVSTVGCGDCLLAGFVAGLADEMDLLGAYRLALATATANVLGGGPAEFDYDDVQEFLGRIQIETLS